MEFADLHLVPDVLRPELEDLKRRAATAARDRGAAGPLTYVGAGMTSMTFQDEEGAAYKVFRRGARRADTPEHRRFLRGLEDNYRREADYLRAAGTNKALRGKVATYLARDDASWVIVRKHIEGRPGGWGSKGLREAWEKISDATADSWGYPEFKEDSFILTRRGPVLVDAGPAFRRGKNYLADLWRKLVTGVEMDEIELQDAAWELRMEVLDKRLTEDQAKPALEELYRRGAPRE